MSESDGDTASHGKVYISELVQDAPCGFLVTDTRERALYANDTLGLWLGRTPAEIAAGMSIKDILTRESHLLFQTQVATTIQVQGFAREVACKLKPRDMRDPLPVLMNAVQRSPRGELPARIDFVFFDATERTRIERRLREKQKEAEELAAIVRNATVGILRCDENGRIIRLNAAAARILGIEPDHLPDEPIDRLLVLDGEDEDWFATAITGPRTDREFEANRNSNYYNISIGRIANPEEPYAARQYSVILRDISQRVLAEQRMELLVGELNHRVRNALTVVMGVVRQSIRSAPLERDKLLDRLQNMARSLDVLTQNYWKDASIRDIFARVETQLGENQKVLIDGPDVRLVPEQFKALSMAVHELTTNAQKYGALLADAGMIEISWSVERADERTIDLLWRESGGPTVSIPKKTGFGTAMIEQALTADFDGSAEVRYRPEGLEFAFRGVLRS